MRLFFSCLTLLISLFLAAACTSGILLTLILAGMEQSPPPALLPDYAPPVLPIPVPPAPDCPDCPPQPPDNKNNRRKHWAADECRPVGPVGAKRGSRDGPSHNGQEVQIDIPADLLKRNISSKGLGCCVFRANEYACIFNNIPEGVGIPEKMKEAGIAGGGWPEKFDEIMKRFAPNYQYVQIQDGNWDILKLAMKTGRAVPITVMGGSHMVTLVKLENGAAAFRDNNYTGPKEIWWMSEQEAKKETICRYTGNKFWAVIPLNGRPPPPPRSPRSPRAAGAARRKASPLSPELLPGKYEWGPPLDGEQWPLFHDGEQVGAFVPEWDCYCERTGPHQWGDAWRRPPVPLPPDALAALEQPEGVLMDRLTARECYSVCGREVSREQAMAMIEDDSAKLSLTAIGAKEETARVRGDLQGAEFAQLRSHVVFQEYRPNDWAISPQRYGFDASGHPTVYLQRPDGAVLWHSNQYDGTPTLRNIRKADPNYKPGNDPGMPHEPTPTPLSGWHPAHLVVCVFCLTVFSLSLAALSCLGFFACVWGVDHVSGPLPN